MELSAALIHVRSHNQGVLVTLRRDGRAQLSNIVYGIDDDSKVSISVTEDRAKTKNLRRNARAELYVPAESFWQYVVLDGTAELSSTAQSPHDATVDELVALYRRVRGEEHPDWDEFRAAMVNERRLVIRFTPTSAYGQLRS
jgi:PPOX class probable F420-dependent enzyme